MFDDQQRRLDAYTRVLAISVLACLGFSWKLWLSRPYYPLVPVAAWIPQLPPGLDAAVLAAMVGLLVAIAIWPRARKLCWSLLAIWGFLFLQDQNRWWPSFYQFFLLFAWLASTRPAAKVDDAGAARALAGLQFVFAAVYFWSGVQKLNRRFFEEEFPWFLEPVTSRLPWEVPALPWLGLAAALFELAIGVGLLTTRLRRLALYDAMAMHLIIFFCIGPFRGHWNNSAWAWNLTVAIQTWILFYRSPPLTMRAMFVPAWRRNLAAAAVVALMGVAPVLNNFNRWDSALSLNVYSGNVDFAEIHLSPVAVGELPAELRKFVRIEGNRGVLSLQRWTQAEFNANPYPETRVFRAVFRRVCELLEYGTATLYVHEKSGWWIDRETRREEWPSPKNLAPKSLGVDERT